MPTYQYRCTECGHDLEVVQKFSDSALTECPSCHGQLRKVFNAVGVVFKGSGFYRTDSRPKEGASNGSSSTGDGKGKDGGTNGSSEAKGGDAKPAAKADGAKGEAATSSTSDSAKKPAKTGSSTGSSAGS